jgi:hypothetical protein
MRSTPLLAALLMLGGVSCAYAQEGTQEGVPSASERGSSAAQERGTSPDAGVNNRSAGGEEGPGASGKSGDSPKDRSAEKSDRSNEKGSAGRAASDEDSGKKSDRSNEKGSAGRAASDEDSGKKSSKSTAKSDSGNAASSKRTSREGSDPTDKSAATKENTPSDKTDRSATDTSKSTTTDRSAESKTSGDKAKHVDLTGDKRTKVQSAFRDAGNVKHRTDVNIDISVGRRLPRDWDFVPVPTAVIAIVPEYRDYYFAYVEDEYVIVEPDTYEVVAVLPAERSQAGASSGRQAGSGQCSAQLSLSSKERELILDNVRGGREADVPDISVGLDVPKGIELQRFPDSVLAEAKALEGCQYFDAGDEIAIVDPNEDKIVLIIDKS